MLLLLRLFDNLTVRGNGHNAPRDKLSAGPKRLLYRVFDAAAAGHLHSDDGHAFDLVPGDDLRQFLGVVHHIQFRAADQGDPVFNEVIVEVPVGVSGAVGGDQQIRAVKIGCVYGNQLDLYRPLGKAAVDCSIFSLRLFMMNCF